MLTCEFTCDDMMTCIVAAQLKWGHKPLNVFGYKSKYSVSDCINYEQGVSSTYFAFSPNMNDAPELSVFQPEVEMRGL